MLVTGGLALVVGGSASVLGSQASWAGFPLTSAISEPIVAHARAPGPPLFALPRTVKSHTFQLCLVSKESS